MSNGLLTSILLYSVLVVIRCQSDEKNKVFILIDNVHVFECRGIDNQATIDSNDIVIIDSNDQTVKYIEAPGDYKINFKKIKVKRKMANLNGFLRITLQTPLTEGALGVNWNVNYQALPHKTLLDGSQCDDESGVVVDPTDKSIEYCKYCDLCSTAKISEKALESFLPNSENEKSLDALCSQISEGEYQFIKTVHLPDKSTLDQEANKNFKGIDDRLKQRLSIGKGKMHVYLILQSSADSAQEMNQWHTNTQGCNCCAKDDRGNNLCTGNPLSRSSNKTLISRCHTCNNLYVQNCLRGSSEKVACFTVEFNYHVTDKRSDLDKFLKIQGNTLVQASSLSVGGQSHEEAPPPSEDAKRNSCVQSISSPTFATYCKTNWDQKFCCDLPSCKGKC